LFNKTTSTKHALQFAKKRTCPEATDAAGQTCARSVSIAEIVFFIEKTA